MSQFKSGTGSVLQMAKQTTWGTSAAPTNLLNMSSESINYTINKEAEGTLLGTKTEASRDLTSIRVDGSVSMNLKPDFADILFEQALGEKTVITAGVETEYTLADPGVDLPLSTLVLRRGGAETSHWNERTYPDVTISSISFEAPAQNYVTCDINIMGTKELLYTDAGKQTVQDLTLDKGTYRCTSASLVFGNGGTDPVAGATCFPVETTTITIDNGVAESPATYCSGFYAERPVPGQRTVTVDFNVPYSVLTENFRNSYFKADAMCALKLKFEAKDSADEYIEVYMPYVSLTDNSGNVGGADMIDCSFSGVALSYANAEPIKITVHHEAEEE